MGAQCPPCAMAMARVALAVASAQILMLFAIAKRDTPMVGRNTRIEGVLVADQKLLTGDEQFEANQDKCKAINRCSGHGVCVDGGSFGFACECLFGWGGEDCGTGLCPNNCSGTGVCNTEKARCKCNFGYRGVNCSKYLRDEICPNDCSGHGTCGSGEDKGLCFCYKNWGGVDCSPNMCPGNCSDHGACMVVDPSFGNGAHCKCEPGWQGEKCDKREKFCDVINGKTCAGNGYCNKDTGGCVCKTGWLGEHCDLPECTQGYLNHATRAAAPYGGCPNDCSCHGMCVCDEKPEQNPEDVFPQELPCYCACEPGYGGRACEVVIPELVPFKGTKGWDHPLPDIEVYPHLHPHATEVEKNVAASAGRTKTGDDLADYEDEIDGFAAETAAALNGDTESAAPILRHNH